MRTRRLARVLYLRCPRPCIWDLMLPGWQRPKSSIQPAKKEKSQPFRTEIRVFNMSCRITKYPKYGILTYRRISPFTLGNHYMSTLPEKTKTLSRRFSPISPDSMITPVSFQKTTVKYFIHTECCLMFVR